MKVIDTLDKSKAYRLKDLTLRQKTQIFEEVYGEMKKGNYLETYLTGSNKNMPLWLEYTGHAWIITSYNNTGDSDLRGHFNDQFSYNSKTIVVL